MLPGRHKRKLALQRRKAGPGCADACECMTAVGYAREAYSVRSRCPLYRMRFRVAVHRVVRALPPTLTLKYFRPRTTRTRIRDQELKLSRLPPDGREAVRREYPRPLWRVDGFVQ